MLGIDLAEEENRGKIKLGGCIVLPYKWHCNDCGNEWE